MSSGWVEYTIVLILGAILGAAVAFAALRIFKWPESQQLSSISNLAQTISVLIAMVAVLVTLLTAKDQAGQQKLQYTRQYIDALAPTARADVIAAAHGIFSISISQQIHDYLREKNSEVSNADARRTGAHIDGAYILAENFHREAVDRARIVFRHLTAMTKYINDINSCIRVNLCDATISLSALCSLYDPLAQLQPLLKEEQFLYTALRKYNTNDDIFMAPQVLDKQLIFILMGLKTRCPTPYVFPPLFEQSAR